MKHIWSFVFVWVGANEFMRADKNKVHIVLGVLWIFAAIFSELRMAFDGRDRSS